MKIEFLYFEGCPHHEPALQLLEKVMTKEGIASSVKKTDVVSELMAQQVRFAGSPSIRINDQDIEAEGMADQGYGRKCRVYSVNGALQGIPPESLIRNAMTQAKTKESCCK
jgi:hypothetical protein